MGSTARLHQLVDALPEAERATVERVLEALAGLDQGSPFFTLATAPIDDEPEADDEKTEVAEGEADLAAGRFVTADMLERKFGMR